MAKRDPQVFEWSAENGRLEIVGRKDGPMDGVKQVYLISNYPDEIVQNLADAGFKAVFQQRTSQVESDRDKLSAWKDLDAMFQAGTWEREGGARGAPIVGAWVEVLAEVKGVTVGAIQATLAKLEKDARDAVRKNVETKYAQQIAAKKDERTSEGIDLSDI